MYNYIIIRFCEFIDPNSSVEFLCLRGNKISSKTFQLMCEKLKSTIALTEINLFDNLIDDDSISSLSDMLRYNRSLNGISLGNNNLKGENLFELVSAFMPYSVESKDDKAKRDKIVNDTKNAYKELSALSKKRKAMVNTIKKPELDIPTPPMPDLGTPGKKDNLCPGNNTLNSILYIYYQ